MILLCEHPAVVGLVPQVRPSFGLTWVVVGNHVSGYNYDANGNVTGDGTYTYSYDAEHRPTSIVGGPSMIYDALDRLVEVQNSSNNTEIVYSPDGLKFAYMNGSSVIKYIAPLAAGLQAVYTSATPAATAYWRHADWLGSGRLASNANQTMYFDGAYGAFGE